jgi:hypothetical protein
LKTFDCVFLEKFLKGQHWEVVSSIDTRRGLWNDLHLTALIFEILEDRKDCSDQQLNLLVKNVFKKQFGIENPNFNDIKICKQLSLCAKAIADFLTADFFNSMKQKDFFNIMHSFSPPTSRGSMTLTSCLQKIAALAYHLSPETATDEKNQQFRATITKILEAD